MLVSKGFRWKVRVLICNSNKIGLPLNKISRVWCVFLGASLKMFKLCLLTVSFYAKLRIGVSLTFRAKSHHSRVV